MIKKILISGPESSGKTTLTQQLAAYYACPWVPEYARTYLENLGRDYSKEDLANILAGQLQWQEEAASQAPPLLFCDTGPEVIYIWSRVRFGSVDPQITRQLAAQHYDFRLLCYPDLTWEFDPLREAPTPEMRLKLWQHYEDLYQQMGWKHVVIRGQSEQRLAQTIAAVELLLVNGQKGV